MFVVFCNIDQPASSIQLRDEGDDDDGNDGHGDERPTRSLSAFRGLIIPLTLPTKWLDRQGNSDEIETKIDWPSMSMIVLVLGERQVFSSSY